MKKYEVQYARIEHQVYLLEVEAEDEEQARELAREQFTGDKEFRVVHADEFVNGIEEVEE